MESNNLFKKYHMVGGKSKCTRVASLWYDMNKRCTEKFASKRYKTYAGCSVSPEFLDFQHFAKWAYSQIGYGVDGYHLDKDILVHKNKVYGESTCVFVSGALNSFLTSCSSARGVLPQGVTYNEGKTSFRAYIRLGKGHFSLGSFKSVEEASEAYKVAKEAEAYRWYERLRDGEFIVDPRVIERMRTWVFVEDTSQGVKGIRDGC